MTRFLSLNISSLINRIRGRDTETADSLLRLQQAVDQLQQVVAPLVVGTSAGVATGGAHRLLSATHDDTTVATVARGDVVTGQGIPPKWRRLPVGTVGQTLQSTGTDVAWGAAPAAAPHAILSATHSDTTPAAVARGGLMVGQTATPKWQQLTVGTVGQVLTSDGTDAAWATPAAPGTHSLLSATHPDTLAAVVVRGDVIVANSTPAWSRVPIGTSGQVLTSNGTDAAWATPAAAGAHTLLSATHTDTTVGTVVRGDVLVGKTGPTWDRLGIGTSGYVLTSDGTDAAWAAATGSGVAVGTGTDATKSGTSAGDLWLPSDGVYIRRYTGAAWANWGPIFPMTEPVDGDYAWVNQGGASTTTTNGGVFLSGPATAGNSLRIRKKAAPGTPYTITVAFHPLLFPANDPYCGILFRESGTGKLVTMYIEYNSAWTADWALCITKWTNETTFSAYYDSDLDAASLGDTIMFRMTDNATNLIFSFSRDGQNFLPIRTVSRTDFMAGAPNEVGFFVNAGNASNDAGMTLLNWKET